MTVSGITTLIKSLENENAPAAIAVTVKPLIVLGIDKFVAVLLVYPVTVKVPPLFVTNVYCADTAGVIAVNTQSNNDETSLCTYWHL